MRYVCGIAVLVALAAGFVFFFTRDADPSTPANDPVTSSSTEIAPVPRIPPEGWKEYISTGYRFSLFYPSNMNVSETDEGGGAMTITFQNTTDIQGFQIFVVPYAEAQVSEAQFRKDILSGVRKDLKEIEVDGAIGTAFYSTDSTLGDTREIWFIKNGFLYEATALKSDGPLLDTIMQSWKFI